VGRCEGAGEVGELDEILPFADFFFGSTRDLQGRWSGVLEGRGSQPTNGTQRERGSELQGFVMGSSLVVEMARKGPGVAKIS
jgi:hypothetical protein